MVFGRSSETRTKKENETQLACEELGFKLCFLLQNKLKARTNDLHFRKKAHKGA